MPEVRRFENSRPMSDLAATAPVPRSDDGPALNAGGSRFISAHSTDDRARGLRLRRPKVLSAAQASRVVIFQAPMASQQMAHPAMTDPIAQVGMGGMTKVVPPV